MITASSLWSRINNGLMLHRRETRLLLASAIADSFGTGIFTATSVLFFTNVRGFSASAVGLAISVGSMCAFCLSPRIGALADRFGPQRCLIILFIIRAVGYGLFLLADQYWIYMALTCLVTIADRASPTLNQTLMGRVFESNDRATILGTMFSARNGAIVLGSLTATLPIVTGSSSLYLVGIEINALTFIIAAILIARLHIPEGNSSLNKEATKSSKVKSPLHDWKYSLITISNGVAQTHNTIISLVLPLWVVNATASPKWGLTALLACNGVLSMLAQIPINRLFADFSSALRASALGGIATGVACLVYAIAGSVEASWAALSILTVAMLAHTMGECFFIASTPLSFELAPQKSLGQYLSFYNLGRVGQDLIGPLLIVGPLVSRGFPIWLLVGIIILLGGLMPWVCLKNNPPLTNG